MYVKIKTLKKNQKQNLQFINQEEKRWNKPYSSNLREFGNRENKEKRKKHH